jgi:steroid 5-alpha reductase family enzyme
MSWMLEAPAAWLALACCAALAFATWVASVIKRDASIVDSFWSVMIFGAALAYALMANSSDMAPRREWLIALVAAWALRLCAHITWRNHGRPEDRRYQAIRARNEPGYVWKSLYLVFGLQAALAWVVALPAMAAASADAPHTMLDAIGAVVALAGLGIEALADLQLARFLSRREAQGAVLDTGLWRYSRHPNYFGECVFWWGIWLVALSAGAGWTVIGPLLMTVLLLKVSGVTLLEADIAGRRPAYVDYVRRTNAFIPGPRKAPVEDGAGRINGGHA